VSYHKFFIKYYLGNEMTASEMVTACVAGCLVAKFIYLDLTGKKNLSIYISIYP